MKEERVMVNIINCSMKEFMQRTTGQELIAFGAGRLLESLCEWDGIKQIKYVIDSDEKKSGTYFNIAGKKIMILGKGKLRELKRNKDAVIITATLAAASILKVLDACEYIDGIDCYILPLMIDKDEAQQVFYPKREQKIPKIIHYCWFGKTEMPSRLKKYMESWKKFCPDYEIIRWDESNYDVSKNQYMEDAYKSRKWGFVPDYARIDIVYQYGGIYLDTDVEIVKSFDDLLCSASFMGYTDKHDVALGLGFGAEKGNLLLLDMREYYEGKRFIKPDGGLDLRMCLEYQYPVLEKWGFNLNGIQEQIGENVIYPREVFNPLGRLGVNTLFTENTHSIHHAEISWESDKNRSAYMQSIKKNKKRIGQ